MRTNRILVVGIVALLLLCGGILTALRRATAGPQVRHVVLISIDTCRADHLGCYGGNPAATPHLDALSAHATLFENAVSPAPMTLPAHCAMLTGTTPLRHGVHDNFGYRLDPANVTLAELFRTRGYATGAFVSAYVLDAKFGLNQGFDTYDDDLPVRQTVFGDLSERRAGETTARACDWIDAHRDAPFFVFVHYYDPHAAYDPPEPYAARFRDDPYAGEIAYVDANIERLFDRLKQAGLYDSALIVVTADHGEMLGEHGERTHSYFVYESAIRVPLIVKLPGVQTGRRVDQVVGLIDIAPTLCSLIGVESGAMDGRALTDFLPSPDGGAQRTSSAEDDSASDRYIYAESYTPVIYDANPLCALVSRRWKYILANRPELYDWAADPAEASNQVETEPEIAADLRSRLIELIEQTPSHDAVGDAASLDAEDRRQLEALGYVAILHADGAAGVDPARSDPKDRIAFHENVKRLAVWVAEREFEQADRLSARLLEIWPGFQRGHVIRGRIALERGDMENAEKHIGAALKLDPQDADALKLLGDIRFAQGDAEASVAPYRLALAQDATSAQAHMGLGIALAAQDKLPAAMEQFNAALAIDPSLAEAHHNLALAWARQGNTDEAIAHYRAALRISPRLVEAHVGLGLALESRGDLAEAASTFEQALELAPERADVHHNLGTVRARQGEFAQAIDAYREALRLRPDYPQARNNLGIALVVTGRSAEALPHFQEALRSRPDWLDPLNAAAWILATHRAADVRDPVEAVRLAERAARISRRKIPSILDTLAAAYAATGDFTRGLATAQEALALAERDGDTAQASTIRARIALYELHQPYIESPEHDPPEDR